MASPSYTGWPFFLPLFARPFVTDFHRMLVTAERKSRDQIASEVFINLSVPTPGHFHPPNSRLDCTYNKTIKGYSRGMTVVVKKNVQTNVNYRTDPFCFFIVPGVGLY
jgi:hypothetical protein